MIGTEVITAGGDLAAAQGGDEAAFARLVSPYQRELLLHCYRILGSLEDAEDALQETLLRAWRRLDTVAGRATLRAWLYKIATNAALDALDRRRRRVLPNSLTPPARPDDPLPPIETALWLEPLPDNLIEEHPSFNPEARYEARESVELAFLAALQQLPGRQRAVLILRDVLGWRADEVAALLDASVQAVNSALQRARATMRQLHARRAADPDAAQVAALLARYVAAWESADARALVALLREDAIMTMPPLSLWLRGRADIVQFLAARVFSEPLRFRALLTRANGCPAVAIYGGSDGAYRPSALHVLGFADGQIGALHDFLVGDEKLFARFGLPTVLTD